MTTRDESEREALARIEALISGGDRATVNERNAFQHFTALNRTLLNIRDIARAALASPANCGVQSGGLTFGALVENIAASDRNPIKRGLFIRKTSAKMAEYATKEGCHSTPLDNLRAASPLPSAEGK